MEIDTVSFVVIVVAIAAAAVVVVKTVAPSETRQRFAAAAVSVLLFLAYFIYAGGDYMVGRFFSTPLVISVVLLAESLRVLEQGTPSADAKKKWLTSDRRERLLWLAFVTAFFIPLAIPDFVLGKATKPTIWKFGGLDMQQHPWNFYLRSWQIPEGFDTTGITAIRNSLAVSEDETHIRWNDSAGIHAFYSGPCYGIIDPYGLVDPLLCRLPAEGYNPGHYFRKTPAGYEHARRTGDSSLMNPHLREYYEKLRFVRSAPLFSPERISGAISYARGADDHLTREYVADMASDPEHKNDFWITRLTRHDRLSLLSRTKNFRGPFVAWYARMLSGNEESKQP